MRLVLDWMPLVWTLRVACTALLAGVSLVAIFYLLRFLRPKHAAMIVGGDLPSVRAVGASAKVLGTEVEARAVIDDREHDQIGALKTAVAELRQRLRVLESSVVRRPPDHNGSRG